MIENRSFSFNVFFAWCKNANLPQIVKVIDLEICGRKCFYHLKVHVSYSKSSLRENPKFLQNFRHIYNTIKANFGLILLINIFPCNYGLELKGKSYYITKKIVCIS
jgi:hypothetical protein